jgi:hypothetical protein
MKYIPVFLLLPLLLISGCSKEDTPGNAGEITLTSELYGTGPYYALGYNFALGKMVKTSTSPGPDITVLPQSSPDNTVVESAYLSSNNLKESFSFNASFDNLSEAETFFNNYLEVDDAGGYSGIASDIKPYQIWTYRTSDTKYVKMLILKVKKEIRSDTPYAETTLRFVYQPDGSRTFPQ